MSENVSTTKICDCHIHSFAKSATRSAGAYTPPEKDLSDYVREASPFCVARAVVIQASVDGFDNSRLAQVLETATNIEVRGVASIEPDASDLTSLHNAGVRAVRVQDRARLGLSGLAALPALAQRAVSMGWHVELNTEPESYAQIAEYLRTAPDGLTLVLDHIAHVAPDDPTQIEQLCRLLDTGRVWTKLSPTRVTKLARTDDYSDLAVIVEKLASAYPDRCVWGSDWPHVMIEPPLPKLPPMLDLLSSVMSTAERKACMWDNPERLYGF
jgi:predicted TIM-barrel fold metal-dependent hydrolase